MARKADAGVRLPTKSDIQWTLESILPILDHGVRAGVANVPLSLVSINTINDLLHGGAYSKRIQETPYFAPDFVSGTGSPSSPYNPGAIQGLYSLGVGGWLAQIASGNNGAALADEVLWNANVPHVLPKLMSDQAYAMNKLLLAQAATGTLFTQAATGLKTLTEGVSNIADIPQTQRRSTQSATLDTNAQTPEQTAP